MVFKLFNKDVNLLPEIFDQHKKAIIKNFRDDALATKRYILKQKRIHNLDSKYVIKYRNDIKAIPGYYPYMLCVSLIPNWAMDLIYKLYKNIKHDSNNAKD